MVLLFHAHLIAKSRLGGSLFPGLFAPGVHGADLFFVLSGFLMFWVHEKDFDHPERLKAYAWKRFSRIYPTYWVALAAFLCGGFLLPAFRTASMTDPLALAASVLLLPHPLGPILPVAWTLCYEVTFYALFGLMIWRRAVGASLLAVWLLISLTLQGGGAFPLSFFSSAYAVHFVLGAFAALIVRHRSIPFPRAMITVGVAIFVATVLLEPQIGKFYARWGHGFAGAFMFAGLSKAQIKWPLSLRALGDASYSIYLVHNPLMVVAARFMHFPPWLNQSALILVGLSGGFLFYFVVERRFLIQRRRLSGQRPAQDPLQDPELSQAEPAR